MAAENNLLLMLYMLTDAQNTLGTSDNFKDYTRVYMQVKNSELVYTSLNFCYEIFICFFQDVT